MVDERLLRAKVLECALVCDGARAIYEMLAIAVVEWEQSEGFMEKKLNTMASRLGAAGCLRPVRGWRRDVHILAYTTTQTARPGSGCPLRSSTGHPIPPKPPAAPVRGCCCALVRVIVPNSIPSRVMARLLRQDACTAPETVEGGALYRVRTRTLHASRSCVDISCPRVRVPL